MGMLQEDGKAVFKLLHDDEMCIWQCWTYIEAHFEHRQPGQVRRRAMPMVLYSTVLSVYHLLNFVLAKVAS